MKKLTLDVESLAVESFEVFDTLEDARGTVKGAGSITETCPPTMMLSQCASRCMQSGIQQCIATQTCC